MELIPKAQSAVVANVLLTISGYTTYTSFDPSLPEMGMSGHWGVSMYVNTNLKSLEVFFSEPEYAEHLWLELPLIGADKLFFGCIYQSPSQSMLPSSAEL